MTKHQDRTFYFIFKIGIIIQLFLRIFIIEMFFE